MLRRHADAWLVGIKHPNLSDDYNYAPGLLACQGNLSFAYLNRIR